MIKRGLFCALLFCIFAYSADQEARQEFFNLYYKGDYEKAHAQLSSSIADPVKRQIWESRIHIRERIPSCSFSIGSHPSSDAFAYLSIGQFENARKNFTDDWISLWGKALYSQWSNDIQKAREQIHRALDLQPENPDLLFFAGDVAETPEKTMHFFHHFLKRDSDDPVKRSIAEFTIELLKKTADMQLNILRVEPGVWDLETDYGPSGIAVRGTANSNEKLKLIVDTGAGSGLVLEKRNWTPKVINDVVMLGLGKRQISTSKRIVLDRFETGKLSIENPLVTENETMPFSDIDGLLGSALFGSHRVLLPVKSGKNIVLLPYDVDPSEYFSRKKVKFSKKETVRFYLVNKLIMIKGRIKKSSPELDFMLDTGADSSLISIAAAKKHATINYPLSLQLRRQSRVNGMAGKAENLLISENVEVGIGKLSRNFNSMLAMNLAETSEALGLEIDLLLGRDFLEGYTLLIDYRNRELTFLR